MVCAVVIPGLLKGSGYAEMLHDFNPHAMLQLGAVLARNQPPAVSLLYLTLEVGQHSAAVFVTIDFPARNGIEQRSLFGRLVQSFHGVGVPRTPARIETALKFLCIHDRNLRILATYRGDG